MASPQSTTSVDGTGRGAGKKNLEQITFRFCSECSNMLYPKEDPDAHKLQFTCRTCQYTEDATSTRIFCNVLNNAAGETAGVTQDVGSDPTVGLPLPLHHSLLLPSPCHAAFASGSTGHEDDDSGLVICLMCGTTIHCIKCGDVACATVPETNNRTVDMPHETLSQTIDHLLANGELFYDYDDCFDDDGSSCNYKLISGTSQGAIETELVDYSLNA